MNPESIRILIGGGFFMMLLFLRLDAGRFGAAEYYEPGRHRTFWTRLAWYLIGGALLAALYLVHPAPHDVLLLLIGHREDVLAYGAILTLIGLAQAGAFAWYRYGYLRLPSAWAYPGAVVNSIGTAVIDEATFRGALLGTLVAVGMPNSSAILMAAIIYVLATRVAGPGHHPYTILVAAGIGLLGGWATLATGGIGAAIVGHAVTSFAIFVCTGHPGQVPLTGREPEELELVNELPEGWQDVRRPTVAGHDAAPPGSVEEAGQPGFTDRTGRRPATPGRVGVIVAWLRSSARSVTKWDHHRAH
jgi:membrane protease YdiL (CAAX protease family)